MGASHGYWESPPPAGLKSAVVCGWGRKAGSARPSHVVPDGCVDLIADGERLLFAGPDLTPVPVSASGSSPRALVGVRMRMCKAQPLLRLDAREVVNCRVPLEDILGAELARGLEARLSELPTSRRLTLLLDFVRRQADNAPCADALAVAASESILAGAGNTRIDCLADDLGYSERQLHRRFSRSMGYGPKTFARIVRFQAARALLGTHVPLITVAWRCGYVDPQHLAREFAALGGRGPGPRRPKSPHDHS